MIPHRSTPNHRNRKQQLDLFSRLEIVAAADQAETETPQHATVRRLSRFFDDFFPSVGRINCWNVAMRLADADAASTIRLSYLEALADVARAAIARFQANEAAAHEFHAWSHPADVVMEEAS